MTRAQPSNAAAAGGNLDQEQSSKYFTVIFNPESGTGDPQTRKRHIEAVLAQHGYRCQHLVTTPEQDARYHAGLCPKKSGYCWRIRNRL